MTVELINPKGLHEPDTHIQVGLARGSTMVFLSGQVARDEKGEPVGGGDLAAQTEQACRNVVTALAGVGASFDDVVKMTIYVVDWEPEKMEPLLIGATRAAEALGINPVKPTTLIGVQALGEPDLLVEIEAIAVLD